MSGPLSLAVAQTVPVRGDVAANVARHVELARAAAELGARVVVFPELSLTGYELDLAPRLAFAEDDARLAPLADAAGVLGAVLVAGASVRLGARLAIGAFAVAPDRSVALYTKRRLGAFPADAHPDGGPVPPAEDTCFEPGDRDPLVSVEGRLAALAVCADTGDPEHARRAADRGARLYLASMFVVPADLAAESDRLADRAARHGLAVALANFGGPTGGLPSAGGSAIWSPDGRCLARLAPSGPGVAVATEGPSGWSAARS